MIFKGLRQIDGKGTALPRDTFYNNVSSMLVDNTFDDIQSQPRALSLRFAIRDAIETVKEVG